jgi:hypothetical protein
MPHPDSILPKPQVHEDEYCNIGSLDEFEADFVDETHELLDLAVIGHSRSIESDPYVVL